MPEILVTFGEIAHAQGSVAATAARIAARLAELKQSLAPLVAGWQGEAAADYQATQRRWDAAADDLHQVLARIGTALSQAHEGYQQVERTNAGRWE